jgi:type IV secretory pathway TrbD component
MPYDASLPFRGNREKAFQLAESALAALGFRLKLRTPASLQFVGPGMNSTKQSPLTGASRIDIRAGSSSMDLEAELGGAEFMARFVSYFPLGLCVALAAVLSLVFGILFGTGMWMVAVAVAAGGPAVMWLFLGPVLGRRIRERTCRALDALLESMVTEGQSPSAYSGEPAT